MAEQNDNEKEEGKRQVKAILYIMGAVMVIAGTAVAIDPGLVGFLGMDGETARYLGFGLILAGISDIIGSRLLFSAVDRK